MNPLRMNLETLRVGGHRGHSAGAPENTLAAFRKAFEHAGPLVTCETDLSMTSDGELVLMHDKTVDRTTNGHGIVQNMTYAELSKLDAGSWFGKKFAGERIPLLRDALHLGRELGIVFQLELKIYDRNEVIIAKLRALIDELGCADLLQFSSFDFVQLKAVKAAIPEVATVGLMHSRLIDPAALARQADLDAMNIEIYHFASGEARQLHDEDFAVFTYLPGGYHEKLMQYGIDVEAQIVQWVREGQLDQLMGDDVAQMARLKELARG
ncbi:glycerophosphodiester phosphodiesterase family protein [Rhizobium sp. LC145]|uniref:glycerophosphodiester phosphodiesterase n=1 Tax=Rhizobium sp. LC145 TaxID=1120688 RepID=UPI000629ED25|nr:glycerophosphodiester phosphodiesterase family protein [Rhizobium sp. LC145]KKX26222.1 phosphodiesterase [Rhizobium sp. LC145]TKT67163.1 phosphodiesterase [Rhizobiaceae bacterium LC148]